MTEEDLGLSKVEEEIMASMCAEINSMFTRVLSAQVLPVAAREVLVAATCSLWLTQIPVNIVKEVMGKMKENNRRAGS